MSRRISNNFLQIPKPHTFWTDCKPHEIPGPLRTVFAVKYIFFKQIQEYDFINLESLSKNKIILRNKETDYRTKNLTLIRRETPTAAARKVTGKKHTVRRTLKLNIIFIIRQNIQRTLPPTQATCDWPVFCFVNRSSAEKSLSVNLTEFTLCLRTKFSIDSRIFFLICDRRRNGRAIRTFFPLGNLKSISKLKHKILQMEINRCKPQIWRKFSFRAVLFVKQSGLV